MSRFHSYLRNAIQIVETYTAKIPFGVHLKSFFSAQKKYGSTDRKQIAILCYDYFRIVAILPRVSLSEKIILARFICRTNPNTFLEELHHDFNDKMDWSVDEKSNYVKIK